MDYVGKRVKITNYDGGLMVEPGQTGKVIAQSENKLVLDLKALCRDWDWLENVIVRVDEVEPVEYIFKDAVGNQIHVGDTVAYGPLGGGVILGIVTDIKERANSRLAIQMEVDSERVYWDGKRRVSAQAKTRRWYDRPYRMRIVQKRVDLTSFPKLTVLPSTGDII